MEDRSTRNSRRKKMIMIQKRRSRLIVLAVLVVILVFVLFLFMKQQSVISQLNESYESQKNAHEALQDKIKELENELKEVNTLEYIEKKAREDLGMIKKDESVYIQEDQNE